MTARSACSSFSTNSFFDASFIRSPSNSPRCFAIRGATSFSSTWRPSNLSRPVVRNVSAAIGSVKLHALLPQHMLRRQQMLRFAASPERNHVRMLAKQQHILYGVGLPRGHNTLLQRVGFRVADQSKVND